MNLLFLGGTGNISSDCAALLHTRGHEISVLTRGKSAIPAGIRAIQADRNEAASMRNALKDLRPDVVLNFIGYDVPDLESDFDIFRGSIRQYLFISSTTVYARPAQKLPFTEDAPQGNPW